jgi:NAD(P)-dependent dehydrogenase (short-subunit alcohol dehydrogenase family)
MDVRNLTGRVGVVTGAASGIGRATALALAERGADVAICDIDEANLKQTADAIVALGRRCVQARVDVAQADQVRDFKDLTYAELSRADVVVNNAGIGVGGNFVDIPLDAWDRIVGINLKGVVHGCHSFAPRMIEAGGPGHIVNIASMAGYITGPGMTPYYATKFAVVGFSEGLRAELSVHGIGVTAICPGVINTPIVRTSRMYGAQATEENMERGAAMFERRNYGPERVARGILKAIQRNRVVAPVSPEAHVGYWLKRAVPRLFWAATSLAARRAAAQEDSA